MDQSEESFVFWFSNNFNAPGGRSVWSEGCHINGIDSSKDSLVGRTACQGVRNLDVSMESSAARRPMTLTVPMSLEILLGIVSTVRKAEMGAVNNVSPALLKIRMSLKENAS